MQIRLLLLDAGAAMQVSFDLKLGPAAEPRAIDLQILHDPLHVVPRLGERDLLDPIDRVDLGIARIAVTLDPFLDAAAAGIVAAKGQDVGAAVVLEQPSLEPRLLAMIPTADIDWFQGSTSYGPSTPERLKGMVAIRLIDLDQGRRLI